MVDSGGSFQKVSGESVDLGSRQLFLYHVTCVFCRSVLLCQFSVCFVGRWIGVVCISLVPLASVTL